LCAEIGRIRKEGCFGRYLDELVYILSPLLVLVLGCLQRRNCLCMDQAINGRFLGVRFINTLHLVSMYMPFLHYGTHFFIQSQNRPLFPRIVLPKLILEYPLPPPPPPPTLTQHRNLPKHSLELRRPLRRPTIPIKMINQHLRVTASTLRL